MPPLAEPEAVVALLRARTARAERGDRRALRAPRQSAARGRARRRAREGALAARRSSSASPRASTCSTAGATPTPASRRCGRRSSGSYDLLSREEQRLFARLSVFAGGCTLEAAEEVCDADLDTLQSLVEKSLLRFSSERYWMLETIREFAAEQLDERGRTTSRRQHRAFVGRARGASARGSCTRPSESAESARLAPDYANLRAAVDYALAAGEPDDVGRSSEPSTRFLDLARPPGGGDGSGPRRRSPTATGSRAAVLPRPSSAAARSRASPASWIVRDRARSEELGVARGRRHAAPELASGDARGSLPRSRSTRATTSGARAYAEQSAAARRRRAVAPLFRRARSAPGDLRVGGVRTMLAALSRASTRASFNHACALEILGEVARRSKGAPRVRGERFASRARAFAELRDAGGVAGLPGRSRARSRRAAGDVERAGTLRGAAERCAQERGRATDPLRHRVPDVPDCRARGRARRCRLDEAVDYALASID